MAFNSIYWCQVEIQLQLNSEKRIIRTGRHELESVLSVISCSFFSVKMVYSSSELQFVRVSAILQNEKVTLQVIHDVNEFLDHKSLFIAL